MSTYPQGLEERARLRSGREVLLRPIRPGDEPAHAELLSRLSAEDSHFRFFHYVRSLPHRELARLTRIDYEREMAFIATAPGPGGDPETLGVARAVADPDGAAAEFAVVVRSDLKRQGIATLLLDKLAAWCHARGLRELAGDVLAGNEPMLELVRRRGGSVAGAGEEGVVRVVLPLQGPPAPSPPAQGVRRGSG